MRTLCIRLALLGASVAAAGLFAQPISLAYKPLDVRYSKSLDRLITISADPNKLHLVNPLSGAETTVSLILPPRSLSVSPDGTHAAVGHDGWISYINLTAGYVEKNLAVSVTADALVLAANGSIFVPPSTTVNSTTGAQTGSGYSPWSAIKPALHPNGTWVYYTRGGSPDDVLKGDMSSGVFVYLYESQYHGDFPVCGPVFFTADGKRLLTGCGTFFRTTSAADDLTYNGSLSAASLVVAAADSTSAGKLAAIPSNWSNPGTFDVEIQFYDNEFLRLLGRVPLPKYAADAPWHGRGLFYSADSTKLYVVLQADPKAALANDYAIQSITLSTGAGCGASLGPASPNIPAAGGKVDVNVTATAGCLWQATPNANWLTLDAGGVATGNAVVSIRAIPNLQTTSRTASVTIAGLTYSVTQDPAAAPGANPVIVSPVRPVAAEYSAALDRMILVSGNPNLLTILDPATGASQTVPLAMPPTSLSISPDGLRAAVGHDGRISYINLSTASLASNFAVSTNVASLALSAKEIFAFPLRDQWEEIRIVDLASGNETLWNLVYAGSTSGRISPNGKYLYINASKRYDITQPLPPGYDAISSYNPRQWFSQDGSRLFSGSGQAYRLSDSASLDLQYNGTLSANGLTAVADSSFQHLTAAITNGSANDTTIRFYNQQYLAVTGSAAIPKFTSGANSYDGHGRYLFWNAAGTSLYAIIQADETSGLLNDFGIFRVSLNGGCSTSLERGTQSVPAAGGTFTVAVTSTAGCVWNATSSAPWLNISTNTIGAGPASLSFIVDPNPTTAARTANIVVDGKALIVTQDAGTAGSASAISSLYFRVIDAEYSSTLDRIVALSGSPSRLNIYDPVTGANTFVALPLPGNAVSISPGGIGAAVCHDGLLSIINLKTATLEKTLGVKLNCRDVVLADNGYAYLSAAGGWGHASSVELATGAETAIELLYAGTTFQLNPTGDAIYTTDTGTSANSASRFRITGGPMVKEYESPWYPDHYLGSRIWFTRDGRILGNSGSVFRTGTTLATDFIYTGTLSGYSGYSGAVIGLSHSPSRRQIVSIGPNLNSGQTQTTDTILNLHGDKYLGLSAKMTLPKLTIGATSAVTHGKFVFWDRAGKKAYVILQADASAGFLNDFGLYTLSPEFTAGCAVTLGIGSGSAIALGESGNVAVTAADDCVWEAKSSASWVQIDSGGLGIGIGNTSYTVLPNYTASARTATLTIGNQTFTLTQAAAASDTCALSLSQTALTTSASGDSLPIRVSATGSNCLWSAQSDVSWITPENVGVKSGTAILQFKVAANAASSARTATIDVAGQAVTVTQAAAGCTFDVPTQPVTIPAAGMSVNVAVTTGTGCAWTPAGSPNWLTASGGTSGNGVLNYSAPAYSGAAARAGSISVADKVIRVIQLAPSPTAIFQDVPLTHPFLSYITLLKNSGVTKGCSETAYCPEQSTTRAQMAAFLVRAILGDNFEFPAAPYFTDVPANHPFFNYIQKLRELGVTAGCTATTYCPDSTVTRGQMAAFLVRARLGIQASDSFSSTTTPYFLDVPSNHPFFGYIQKMKDLGITSGVTATTYGPDDPNTRGQMAVFLIRSLITP
jgi:hypothetical protein